MVIEGALVLDKPAGITSHDAVQVVRRVLGERSVGHLGTLDPFASGVLVLLVGCATRLARFYGAREKSYEGTIRFGFSTDTMDSTGAPTSPQAECLPREDAVRGVFAALSGTHPQTPPPYSAKKVAGTPAYRLARAGREVALAPVPVTVHELALLVFESPLAKFHARVSSGTYLRVLAHDAGERLGVGAHLTVLRRTAVGEFSEAAAVPLEQIGGRLRRAELQVIPPPQLLPEFPAIAIGEQDWRSVRQGRDIQLMAGHGGQGAERLKLVRPDGRLCAIAEQRAVGLYHPSVVLTSAEPDS